MSELSRKYEGQIYRPGEEIEELAEFSDEEQEAYAEEITAAFAQSASQTDNRPSPSDPDFEGDNSFVKVGIR